MRRATRTGLALVAAATAAVSALGSAASADTSGAFVNGDFESPAVGPVGQGGAGWQNYPDGSDLGGWSVSGAGGVDLVSSPYPTHSATHAVDLNGFQAGTISQSFDVIPGATYDVSYWTNSNPDVDPSASDADREYIVDLSGALTYHQANVYTGPGWVQSDVSVTASMTEDTATLSFSGNNAGYSGVILDDVSITKTSADSTVTVTAPSQGSFTNKNSTAVFHAVVTSSDPACVSGRTVTFDVEGTPTAVPVTSSTVATDSYGLASAKYVVGAGLYTVTATVAPTPSCDGDTSDSATVDLVQKKK